MSEFLYAALSSEFAASAEGLHSALHHIYHKVSVGSAAGGSRYRAGFLPLRSPEEVRVVRRRGHAGSRAHNSDAIDRRAAAQNFLANRDYARDKGASGRAINQLLRRQGAVWQEESFDHVLRSPEGLDAKIEYVLQNPVRKGLVSDWRDYRWAWKRESQPEAAMQISAAKKV